MANRALGANRKNHRNQLKQNKDRKKYNLNMRNWYVKQANLRKEHLANPKPIEDET